MRNRARDCECGARPAWAPAEPERRSGRVSKVRPERLRCPECGNMTAADTSRERLVVAWNSAGWCGQGAEAREFVPFGVEWREGVGRKRKDRLVDLLEGVMRRELALDDLVAKLRVELAEADRVIAWLRVRRNRGELYAVIDRLVQRGIIKRGDGAVAKARLAGEGH